MLCFSKKQPVLDHDSHKMKKGNQENQTGAVIKSERSNSVAPQMIVNLFRGWYSELSLAGCSSHSGRRTFITTAARKISLVGGSIRDVQKLAGHQSLQTTERYIESSNKAQFNVLSHLL